MRNEKGSDDDLDLNEPEILKLSKDLTAEQKAKFSERFKEFENDFKKIEVQTSALSK
jgi:hypothetical protein